MVSKHSKYLYGKFFTTLTNSIPVTLISGKENAIPSSAHPSLVRWSLFLSGYNSKITYNKKVQVAECLSRLPSDDNTGDTASSQIYVLNVRADATQISAIQREIKQDPILK